MANYVFVQVRGVDAPARIRADKVEKSGTLGAIDYKLVLKKDDQQVGEFNGNSVDGWWIMDV